MTKTTTFCTHLAAVSLAMLTTPGLLLAGPKLDAVVAGQIGITTDGASTTISTFQANTILNFSSFNLEKGESLHFAQPDASSRVLNRVITPNPSHIDGQLTSNGRIYLVNPAGIFFGKEAIVHAAQFYAVAGRLSNNDFLSGLDRFTDLQGSIFQKGMLQAEAVYLAGRYIENSGSILAPEGYVAFACGDSVLVGAATGHIYTKMDVAAASELHEDFQDPFGVGDITGVLFAEQTRIQTHHLEVQAPGSLLSVNGSLDVSSSLPQEKGGIAVLTGQYVDLQKAHIAADGPAGGGEVFVGGQYKGQGEVPQAERTRITERSRISADALVAGDGGQVIAWADEATFFDGHITARGGPLGGNGGFIETSGKQSLSVLKGHVDTTAPQGALGQWLLDPNTVTVFQVGGVPSIDQADLSALNCDNLSVNVTAIQDAASALTIQTYGDSQSCGPGNAINFGTQDVDGAVTVVMTNNVPVTLITDGTPGVVNFHGSLTTGGAINILSPTINIAGPAGMTLITSSGDVNLGSNTIFPIINGLTATDQFPMTLGTSNGNINIWGSIGHALPGSVGLITVPDGSNFTTHVNPTIAGSLPPVIYCTGLDITVSAAVSLAGTVDTSAATLGTHGAGGAVSIDNYREYLQNIAFQWVIEDPSDSAKQLAVNTVTSGDTILGHASLNTSGGSPIAVGSGYNGGNITLRTEGTLYLIDVTASGGAASGGGNASGGDGGNITLTAASIYAQGDITSVGGLGAGSGPLNLPQIATSSSIPNPSGDYGNLDASLGTSLDVQSTNLTLRANNVTLPDVVGNGNILTLNCAADSQATIASLSNLDSFIVDNVGICSVTGTTQATSIILNNASSTGNNASIGPIGGFSFGGAVTADDLCTASNKYFVKVLGGGTITNPTIFDNCGDISVHDSTLTFTGGLDISHSASAILLKDATLQTTNTDMILGDGSSLGALLLAGDNTLSTGTGLLTLDATIREMIPSGEASLTANAGSNAITFEQPILYGEITGGPYLDLLLPGTGAVTFEQKAVLGAVTTTTPLTFDTTTVINGQLQCDDVTFAAGGHDVSILGNNSTIAGTATFQNTGDIFIGSSSSTEVTFNHNVDFSSGTLNINGHLHGLGTSITANDVVTQSGSVAGVSGTKLYLGGTPLPSSVSFTTESGTFSIDTDIQLNTDTTFISQSGAILETDGSLRSSSLNVVFTGSGDFLIKEPIEGMASVTIDDSQGVPRNFTSHNPITTQSFTQTAGSGTTSLSGNLIVSGASGAPGGNVSVTMDGDFVSTASITTAGGTAVTTGQPGGNISITSNLGSIQVNDLTTSGSNGASGFAGGDAGTITLQPAASFSSSSGANLPTGTLRIDGTLTALGGSGTPDGSDGQILLSPTGRSDLMAVATIYTNPLGGDVLLQGGTVSVGTNEALTAFGSLTVDASSSSTFGDIVTINNLTITAPTITLLTHGQSSILSPKGGLYPNYNLHLLAGGTTIALNGSVVLSGPNNLLSQNTFSLSPGGQGTLRTNLFQSPYALNAFYTGGTPNGGGSGNSNNNDNGNNQPPPPPDEPGGPTPPPTAPQLPGQGLPDVPAITTLLATLGEPSFTLFEPDGTQDTYPKSYLLQTWQEMQDLLTSGNPIASQWELFQEHLQGGFADASVFLNFLQTNPSQDATHALTLLEDLSILREMLDNSALPDNEKERARILFRNLLKPATMPLSQWYLLITLARQLRV